MYWKSFYGCSFPEAKASGKLAFGQLPILDIDGEHQIAQSGAQNRYVASLVKKPGFNPSAPAKVAFCDMIHETHQGVFYLHLLEFTLIYQIFSRIMWSKKNCILFFFSFFDKRIALKQFRNNNLCSHSRYILY